MAFNEQGIKMCRKLIISIWQPSFSSGDDFFSLRFRSPRLLRVHLNPPDSLFSNFFHDIHSITLYQFRFLVFLWPVQRATEGWVVRKKKKLQKFNLFFHYTRPRKCLSQNPKGQKHDLNFLVTTRFLKKKKKKKLDNTIVFIARCLLGNKTQGSYFHASGSYANI